MNLVYLVRHGENPANLTHEFSYRRVDYPLTAKGLLQAEQTAEHLRGRGIDALFSSPLRRARLTAERIAQATGNDVQVLEQFRELNVGDLEDRPPTVENWAVHDRVVAAWRAGNLDEAFPGGENYRSVIARMRDGMERALSGRDSQRIVIVGHGGIFTAAVGAFCPDIAIEASAGAPLHNCSITLLEVERAGSHFTARLLAWGSVEHLSGKAAELIRGTPEPARSPDR